MDIARRCTKDIVERHRKIGYRLARPEKIDPADLRTTIQALNRNYPFVCCHRYFLSDCQTFFPRVIAQS
ncbi:MAG TPA: hypothetical protein VEF04_19365, partial [Blastocatellia bacterium]|nr:hypothetical protein [Blastocatellia bacterium]